MPLQFKLMHLYANVNCERGSDSSRWIPQPRLLLFVLADVVMRFLVASVCELSVGAFVRAFGVFSGGLSSRLELLLLPG